jgi:hypothetical protein
MPVTWMSAVHLDTGSCRGGSVGGVSFATGTV